MKSKLVKGIEKEEFLKMLDSADLSKLPTAQSMKQTMHTRFENENSYLKDLDDQSVQEGDVVTASVVSDLPKLNKPKVAFTVGRNLFNKTIEEATLGKRIGDSFVVVVDSVKVNVNVLSAKRRTVKPFTDQTVASMGIEDVDTLEKYYHYVCKQVIIMHVSTVLMPIVFEMQNQSQFEIFDEDVKGIDEFDSKVLIEAFSQRFGKNKEDITAQEWRKVLGCNSFEEYLEKRTNYIKNNIKIALLFLHILDIKVDDDYLPEMNNFGSLSNLVGDLVVGRIIERRYTDGSSLC